MITDLYRGTKAGVSVLHSGLITFVSSGGGAAELLCGVIFNFPGLCRPLFQVYNSETRGIEIILTDVPQ